jgi:hypothetical protein
LGSRGGIASPIDGDEAPVDQPGGKVLGGCSGSCRLLLDVAALTSAY